MFELSPIKILKAGMRQSRLLRILFLVACLGWLILGVTLFFKPLDPTVALILYGFHLGTWYFALTTRNALYFVLGLSQEAPFQRKASMIDSLCFGIILFCQVLFLITVFRVMDVL